MPAEIAKIAKRFMHDPVEFVVGTRNEGAANVRHIYYMVHARDKYLALKRIADNSPNIYAIIFCRTRRDTQEVAENLIRDGYNADALHGDLSQQQRDMVMKSSATASSRSSWPQMLPPAALMSTTLHT